jgi:diguanylate cyclase (GGDEF)-like protein
MNRSIREADAGSAVAAPGRLRQEVFDARRRMRIGGVFYLFGWTLLVAYSPLGSVYPLHALGVAAAFLVLAVLRVVLRPRLDSVAAQRRWLNLQWGIVFATAALWGVASGLVMLDARFVAANVPILLCTVAYATACAHTLSMRRGRALACLTMVYLPALCVTWRVDAGAGPAWALLVYFAYLVLALVSSHREYRLRLDLDEELRIQRDRFETLSRLDALTGLANRRHFSDALEAEVARAHVEDRPLALLIVDIDHFKRFNDTHGHVAGDLALVAFAQRLRDQLGERGVQLARVGGEEFALLLPGLRADAAAALADRFRADLGTSPLPLVVGADAIRTSIGVADLLPGEMGEAMYLRADRALYRAKAEGRDRVVRAEA